VDDKKRKFFVLQALYTLLVIIASAVVTTFYIFQVVLAKPDIEVLRHVDNDKTAQVAFTSSSGGNLMVLPLDQMLKGGSAPAKAENSGASNLLRVPPASSGNSSANTTPSSNDGDIMNQRRANAQRNDYQRQGE